MRGIYRVLKLMYWFIDKWFLKMLNIYFYWILGMGKIFWKMRMFMKKVVRKGWIVEELKLNFLKLMEIVDFYKCFDEGDLWEYYKKILVYF